MHWIAPVVEVELKPVDPEARVLLVNRGPVPATICLVTLSLGGQPQQLLLLLRFSSVNALVRLALQEAVVLLEELIGPIGRRGFLLQLVEVEVHACIRACNGCMCECMTHLQPFMCVRVCILL